MKSLFLGEHIFSVSAPRGIFPMVHDGWVGPWQSNPKARYTKVRASTLHITKGSSGGAVYHSSTGKIGAVIFAIRPISESYLEPVAAMMVPVKNLKAFLKRYDNEKSSK